MQQRFGCESLLHYLEQHLAQHLIKIFATFEFAMQMFHVKFVFVFAFVFVKATFIVPSSIWLIVRSKLASGVGGGETTLDNTLVWEEQWSRLDNAK